MSGESEKRFTVRETIELLQAEKQDVLVSPKQHAAKQKPAIPMRRDSFRRRQAISYPSDISKIKENETSEDTKPCHEYKPSKPVSQLKSNENDKDVTSTIEELHPDVSAEVNSIQSTNDDTTIEKVDQNSTLITKTFGESPSNITSRSSFLTEISKIDFLLIGKTGNGKSALGNTILKQNVFRSLNSSSSVTKEVTSAKAYILDKTVSVFDAPGFGDTDGDQTVSNKLVLDSLTAAISANPDGYHAFLLVLRFGERFKKEDEETIVFLKSIFGGDFIRKFCILVMTFGDHFEKDNQEASLQEWLSKQKGRLADLLKECNNRVVLFDNKTTDELKQERQLKQLFSFVEDLVLENCRYTNNLFDMAKSTRNKILMGSNISTYEQRYNAILLNLKAIQKEEKLNCDTTLLKSMLQTCQEALQNLNEDNREYGCLQEIINQFKYLEEAVNAEIDIRNRLSAYKCENDLVQAIRKSRDQLAKMQYQDLAKRLEKEKMEYEELYKQERKNVTELENKIRDLYKKPMAQIIKSKLDSYFKSS